MKRHNMSQEQNSLSLACITKDRNKLTFISLYYFRVLFDGSAEIKLLWVARLSD